MSAIFPRKNFSAESLSSNQDGLVFCVASIPVFNVFESVDLGSSGFSESAPTFWCSSRSFSDLKGFSPFISASNSGFAPP